MDFLLIIFILIIVGIIGWNVNTPSPSFKQALVNFINKCFAEQEPNYEVPLDFQRQKTAEFLMEHSDRPENQIKALLDDLQLVLIIDHSGSMKTRDVNPHTNRQCTRWENIIMVASYLVATMLHYDVDGMIPTYFFSDKSRRTTIKTSDQLIDELKNIHPDGGTNLLDVLDIAFVNHVKKNEKTLFIVLTDGQPDPGQEYNIKKLIEQVFPAQDPSGDRLNILFIRVGDDPKAKEFLEDLDNCREIGKWVDTKSDNDVYDYGAENILTNAIYEHLEGQLGQT